MQELHKQFQVISKLHAKICGLQFDNLKLYEKVHHMLSYLEKSMHSLFNTKFSNIANFLRKS